MSVSRRDALKSLGAVGAAAVIGGRAIEQAGLTVAGSPVEIAIAPSGEHSVRITVALIEKGQPGPVPLDGSLARPGAASGAPAARLTSVTGEQRIRCGSFTVSVAREPLGMRVEAADGRLVQHLRIDPETGSLRFRIGDAPLLGLGQGGPQFDRRGSTDAMRSGQGGYRLRTHGGRVPVQWLLGTAGWAMFIHHPLGTFDLTGAQGTEGRFDPGPAGLPLDLFVVGVREPAQVMAEYARLTGHPEMPPLWALGYQQSHRTLAGRDEVLRVARTFREKQLPCDALIYLGTGFTPSGWNTANGSFAFNRNVFDDPKEIIDELHAMHYKVVLHAVILARSLRGTVKDPCNLARYDEEEVGCYWHVHRKLVALGIDGWWPDEGDPLNAQSRLTRNRMYWEGPQLDRPNERPYALHRNGHAGMQRYAAFLWSGDVYTTWETLRRHVPIAINTGLSGIPYWGTDIGGFIPTSEYTGELHVRWFQFGAFCPLFRSHGRTWHLRLPWGWNTGELGPNEITTSRDAANPDPSELRNPHVEPICRKFLELRYRLMPYLYSTVWQGSRTGLPIMRALWLHYPDDAAAVARDDEYLWGRDMLVAPVTEKGATARALYLPRGTWYDFWTDEKVDGGREINRAVDLETMPLYVRAGAILPLGPAKQYTEEQVAESPELRVYPGADGAFTLYEDDGRSFDYRKGEWLGIEARWDDGGRRLALRLAPGSRMLPPAPRRIAVRIAGSPTTRPVLFDGRPAGLDLRRP